MKAFTRRSFLKNTAGAAGLISLSSAIPASWLTFSCVYKQGYFESEFGITDGLCKKVLERALSKGGDFADLYFEHRISNGLNLEDGKVNNASGSVDLGVGIRTVKGDQIGYGFTQELTEESMLAASATAATIANESLKNPVSRFVQLKTPNYYPTKQLISDVPLTSKLRLVKNMNERCFRLSNLVIKSKVKYNESQKRIMIVTSDGVKAEDLQPKSNLYASLIAEKNGKKERAGWSIGGRHDFAYYTDEIVDEIAKESVERTLNCFDTVTPPAGEMPVVLGPGLPGVLLHEAIGHGMEADYNRKNISIYNTMMGKKVAEPFVSIVDDGTIKHRSGSINVDDEAVLAQKTVLIENGILKSYMHDRISARHYKTEPTGNGRRESYEYYPQPRMRNIYMMPGDYTPQEVIKTVKKGIYAKSMLGGQVKIGEGDFAFYVFQGQMIEYGKLTAQIKDFNIMGNGPKMLSNITMVANDLKLYNGGTGICGKGGQILPVSYGLPTCLVKSMTVGGLT